MLPSQEQLCKRRLKDKQQKWTKVEFTLQMYLLNRRNSVATRPFFVYVRAINGFKAPEELRDDPTVQVLKHVATDVNLIGNDILSYKKEPIVDGVLHNVRTVPMQDSSASCCDPQQAIDYAANLLVEALDHFDECRARLPEDSPDWEGYDHGLVDFFVGLLEWEIVPLRFNVFESEEDRKNLVLRL